MWLGWALLPADNPPSPITPRHVDDDALAPAPRYVVGAFH
jgi:hypothetical protein